MAALPRLPERDSPWNVELSCVLALALAGNRFGNR